MFENSVEMCRHQDQICIVSAGQDTQECSLLIVDCRSYSAVSMGVMQNIIENLILILLILITVRPNVLLMTKGILKEAYK